MQFLRRWFQTKWPLGASSVRLYDLVMAGGLAPEHYISGVAKDTMDDRFNMVTLHSVLVMRHLRKYGEAGQIQSKRLYEQVFDGFDYALREQGTSDARIARKIRKLAEIYYGLARALDEALDDSNTLEAIIAVLGRNGIGGETIPHLAEYLRRTDQALNEIGEKQLLTGDFKWQIYAPGLQN